MFDLLVLGATGVSGRQTTKYLAAHPERSRFTLAIAGRSRRKLDQLVADLALPGSIQVFTVDVTDFEQVNALVKQAKVVLNTVGPFHKWGPPVARACARNGVHYVDLTGEAQYIRTLITEHDYLATKTGSILIPACGLDSLPGDIAVHVANRALKDHSKDSSEPLQIDASTTSYDIKGVMSNGTISTIVSFFDLPAIKLKELMQDYYLSPVAGRPSPSPCLVYKMTLPTTLETIVGGYFMMASANKAVVQRSFGLLEREALSEPKANKNRYGPIVYDEFMRQKSTFASILLTVTLAFGMGLMSFSPVRWFIRRMGVKETNIESDKNLEQGKLVAINVTSSVPSSAFPEPVQVQTTISAKGDPGYYLSPVMMAESGLSVLLNYDALPPMARKGGVLTPATALGDVIIKRLQDHGKFDIRWEVVNGVRGESRKSV